MKKICLFAIGLSFLLIPVVAQEIDLSKTLPGKSEVKMGTLENGITYYAQSNPKPADKIELRLVINAGSVLETDKQQGLAHFMEHMNFNGTKNFKKNELVDYLQSIGVKFGADLNAYTSFDETVYILPIPCDNAETLEKGFQVLEDWAHNATLAEEAIDDERGVVLEEYRLGLGSDKRMMQVYLPKLLYGSQYAERLPIGKKEVLENFDYNEVRSFYKDWYRPDLMAVIAVGDLPVEEIERKIKEHFSKIPAVENPKTREVYKLPNHEETFISVATDKEAAFSNVQLMYKDREDAKVSSTYGDYRDDIVIQLFSTMINNRLNELTNKPNPPFVFANSYYGGTYARSKNAYQSFGFTSAEGQLKALKVLLEENKRVKEYGFLESEIDRARKSILSRIEKQYKDRDKRESGSIVGEYIRNFLEDEAMPGIEEEFRLYKTFLPSIRIEEVNALIQNYIHDDNRVIIFTGAEKEGVKVPTEQEIKALLEEVEASKIEPYAEDEVPTSLIAKLPAAATVVETIMNKNLDATTLVLSNGAKVTYKITDYKNDEVLLQGYSAGGMSLLTDEEIQQIGFADGGLTSAGIGGLSLTDMQKFMSGKIARVRPYISNSEEGFNGSASPKDLEIMFQMIHLYFTDLNMDEEAYQTFVDKQKGFLGNLMANPSFYFSNEVGNYKNKGNTRYLGFPTSEKMDESDYALAYKKYQERFADASDFHFYLVGNVDETEVKRLSEQYLATLPSTNSKETAVVPEFRPADKNDKLVVNKGEDPKSSVQISWTEETELNEKEIMAFKALGEVLTIKLIEQLREEESGVYGVGARGSYTVNPYANLSFSISFPCGPENVDKLVKSALAEVEKIKNEGVSDKDLAKVKETYMVSHKEATKTNKFWMDNFIKAERNNSDPKEVLEYEKRVKSISKEDIQNVAKKYLDEKYFLALLMPEK
ncbi:MAG: zinc protease [Vicingaceae bacterium]|jgi:zinc protease